MNEVVLRLLFTVLFLVSFGSISTGNEKDNGHLIQNLILEQTKRVREEINKLGPCKAMSGTLIWTCAKSKDKESFNGSPKRMTIAQIVELGTFYKKLKENEQNKVAYPGIK